MVAYCAIRIAWPHFGSRWQAMKISGVTLMSATLAFSPMLAFYYFNPGIFLAHAADEQAVAGSVVLRTLLGLRNVWLGVSVAGDLVPGRNIIGWPLFDVFNSFWLWLGLGGLIWMQWRQPAAQLVLVWLAIGSLPSALSTNSPAFTRMLLMTPAFAMLIGLGVIWGWRWVTRVWPCAQNWATTLLIIGFCLSGAFSVYGYFLVYLSQPELFDQLFIGGRRVADIAITRATAETVWVTPRSNPFIREPFELLFENTSVHAFDSTPDCQIYPHQRPNPTTFGIIQVMDANTLTLLKQAYLSGAEVETVFHPDGYAFATFFRVPPQAPAPNLAHAVQVDFANGLRLVGYDVITKAELGNQIEVRLAWETVQPMAEIVSSFVHVGHGDNSDPFIGQKDGPICNNWPTTQWEPGYRFIETRLIPIAADAPSGDYDIRVGAYLPGAETRIVITAASVRTENERAVLTPFVVP